MKPWLALLLLSGAALCAPAQTPSQPDPTPVVHVDNPPNTPAQQAKHYVILVSLDGFRYDYPTKYGAPHLQSMAALGASAPDGMLPSFPSLTFPNHLSLVTGLYPEHHGIVGNIFYDPSRSPDQGQTYVYSQSKTNSDGSWYSGTPLWSLAEQQGMRSACLFWPGSEAEIAGQRPSEYAKFDDSVDEIARIDRVKAWLDEPEADRPHFITLYYSDVDHAGHAYGPDAPETKAAVARVDKLIGNLRIALDSTHLPIDLIVVSDHGMVKIQGPWVSLDQFTDLTGFEAVGSLLYGKTEADRVRIYNQLKKASEKFQVYRLKDVPAGLHYNENPREGD